VKWVAGSAAESGPEDEPDGTDDAYEPLDLVDITEADTGPDIQVEE
jgi:hypothetical protein